MTRQSTTQTQQQTPTTNSLSKGGILQRKCESCGQHTVAGSECGECQNKRIPLQRRANEESNLEIIPPIVHEVLRSPGRPLDYAARTFMESRFNHDFSQVQIHTDAKAAESARAIDAQAYTFKSDIVFGTNRYAPEEYVGRRLLAHELTHVVQQGDQGYRGIYPSLSLKASVHHTESLEKEAEAMSTWVANEKSSSDHTPAISKKKGQGNISEAFLYRAPQELTLSEARKKGAKLPRQTLNTMDVITLSKMPPEKRRDWYADKLGSFENQLKESANLHSVPVQLLATVILNELADIDWRDILQSDLAVEKGSLGIAQIQIDTAIRDNLFPDLTEAEGKEAYEEMVVRPQNAISGKWAAKLMQTRAKEQRMAVNRRLQIPQHAIEAAAREIRILLDQMMANLGQPWQTRFGFTHKGIPIPKSAQAIYDDIAGSSQREKELNLANIITGSYNSPKIIKAANADQTTFPNANIHGDNSRMIAGDLFDFKLFRP